MHHLALSIGQFGDLGDLTWFILGEEFLAEGTEIWLMSRAERDSLPAWQSEGWRSQQKQEGRKNRRIEQKLTKDATGGLIAQSLRALGVAEAASRSLGCSVS